MNRPNDASRFELLPQEVYDGILEYMSKETVLHLVCTSRTLFDKTAEVYGEYPRPAIPTQHASYIEGCPRPYRIIPRSFRLDLRQLVAEASDAPPFSPHARVQALSFVLNPDQPHPAAYNDLLVNLSATHPALRALGIIWSDPDAPLLPIVLGQFRHLTRISIGIICAPPPPMPIHLLPSRLTSLTLSGLENTPIEGLVAYLRAAHGLCRLELGAYRSGGTVRVLEAITAARPLHLTRLALEESPENILRRLRVRSFDISCAFAALVAALPRPLRELELRSIHGWMDPRILGIVHAGWGRTLKVLSLAHLCQLTFPRDGLWPALHHLRLHHLPRLTLPNAPFPRLVEVEMVAVGRIAQSSPQPSLIFPALVSASVGSIPWEGYTLLLRGRPCHMEIGKMPYQDILPLVILLRTHPLDSLILSGDTARQQREVMAAAFYRYGSGRIHRVCLKA